MVFKELSEKQLSESLKRRGFLYKEAYRVGVAKLLSCLTQKRPDGDGLPFLLLPYVEELRGVFFAVGVGCGKYDCEFCWYRNECVAELLMKIKQHLIKYNHKKDVNIGEVLEGGCNGMYRIAKKYEVALDSVRRYILKLAGVNIDVIE